LNFSKIREYNTGGHIRFSLIAATLTENLPPGFKDAGGVVLPLE
jgi:hypothetical protein